MRKYLRSANRLVLAIVACATALFSDTATAQKQAGAIVINTDGQPIPLLEPCIFADSKKYFLFGTPFPAQGVQCYESTDLARWKSDGWAWRLSGLHVASGDLHCPRVFAYNGFYYLVYSARISGGIRLALAASVQPQGPYHDMHVPWLMLGEGCSSGGVFVDDDGKAYLSYSQRDLRGGRGSVCIFGLALNKDLSKPVGQPIRLVKPGAAWELSDATIGFLQAPTIFKIGSKYYLTYSTDPRKAPQCAIGYATADKPLGPWSKGSNNPLLASQGEIQSGGPEYPSICRSLDHRSWWVVYQDGGGDKNASVLRTRQLVLEGIRKLALSSSARGLDPAFGAER